MSNVVIQIIPGDEDAPTPEAQRCYLKGQRDVLERVLRKLTDAQDRLMGQIESAQEELDAINRRIATLEKK